MEILSSNDAVSVNQEDVVFHLKEGDMQVLLHWIKERQDKFYRIGWSFFKVQEDIEDALHNAIIIAYERIHTLRKIQFFGTWFTKIFLNECRKIYRTNKKTIRFEQVNSIADREPDLQANKIELREALEKLEAETKEMIILKYVAGYSFKEIGELFDRRENTVKTKVHRGLKAIRKYV
ncbi:RNA polymerase sigma factor [Evansella cellulosilytica]|uniref:RNA polymerase, sigma-24 subunit, ECF subfamily n=1 Tax=Evansella cellulosilytica (strain ATCC 21833 / DSM 2522 / FERM P-1141 / JCM 9156 / N-4) TaxID=649639 RepID=E6TWQ6_EVAC2|nr:RNA polymerase sigma factor [Evansella cellulosilytica]ADU28739.1 RNA polymerase, sigma-24 subunit, ECF subfamily [Evansella cellulosilytica DSM 2522]